MEESNKALMHRFYDDFINPGNLQRLAIALSHCATCAYEGLLRRPAQKDSGSPPSGNEQERSRPSVRGESLLRQALREDGQRRKDARSEENPGKRPKVDERGKRLLEADLDARPAAALPERREFLQKVAGVKVSESTVSRLLKRMGFSRKKDRWVRQKEMNG